VRASCVHVQSSIGNEILQRAVPSDGKDAGYRLQLRSSWLRREDYLAVGSSDTAAASH